ncbi:SGNH/GDSL hydrolase family protein [Amnibacterium kyonggiense]|uniref:SGNH/GDSL hydrolase family protein n=1 Tax=Amnibacterium kyonggiense TaxID=595671 RepID=UPI0013C37741|nr:SGNH/GDSL hydrolase family protein [Amnibacterium kyonggiense]
MDQVTHVGGVSRRASLVGAFGAVALLTAAAVTPPAKPHPSNGGMYLIGDSWAAGLHADPARALGQVAAEVLRMGIHVDAVSGTGYVNTAGHENYLQRARKAAGSPRLVVVQGGSNDDHQSLDAITANARETYRVLRGRFPAARLLVLGPGPDPEPVTDRQRTVDTTLEAAAHAAGLRYVSMLQRDWIPSALADAVIDPDNHHPTVEGHAYLGTRLAASVRLLHPTLFD